MLFYERRHLMPKIQTIFSRSFIHYLRRTNMSDRCASYADILVRYRSKKVTGREYSQKNGVGASMMAVGSRRAHNRVVGPTRQLRLCSLADISNTISIATTIPNATLRFFSMCFPVDRPLSQRGLASLEYSAFTTWSCISEDVKLEKAMNR